MSAVAEEVEEVVEEEVVVGDVYAGGYSVDEIGPG